MKYFYYESKFKMKKKLVGGVGGMWVGGWVKWIFFIMNSNLK